MEMELFPLLEIGWFNGWILLGLWFAVQGLSVIAVSKDVRDRLFEFDRSSWSKIQRGSFATGKLLGLVFLIIAALTPLKTNSIEFYIGICIFVIGILGLVVSIYNFEKTPLDRPVAIGLYKYSRHPQLVMLLVIGIGLGITLGSWTLLLLRLLSFGFEHAGVLAEENECVRRFGEAYSEYMKSVPRYLII